MKQLAALLVFYFTVNLCNGQSVIDSIKVNTGTIFEQERLLDKTLLYIDSSSSLSVSEVLQKPFSRLNKLRGHRKLPPRLISCTFYLKIFLANTSGTPFSGYLLPGFNFRNFDIYKTGQGIVKLNNTGPINGYKKFTLSPGESGYILVKLLPLKNDFNSINPVLINVAYSDTYLQYITSEKSDLQIFGLVLSGILLMMILFMFTNYWFSKKVEFLHNAGYSLCMFLLIFLNSILVRSLSGFKNLYYSYIDFFLLVAGVIFYIAFTRKFLDTKNKDVLLEKILKYSERFVLALLGVYTYLNFFTETYLPQYYLENFMKFFILAIGLAFIFLALKRKDKLFNFIAAGNAALVLFSVISLVLILAKVKVTEIYTSSLFYYNTGIVFELAFFLLGLTYKNRSELIRGIKEQEALKQEAEKAEFETKIAVMTAQQDERNRISADMHDDLGAGMTTIRLYSELAKTKLKDHSIPEIEKISSAANELLSKMNAIIWSMSSSNDSLGNMIAYIRSYALEYFEDTGITCKIEIAENLPNVQVMGEMRRNVFLVVKEALNNILKHAHATEVNIKLTRVKNSLTLYIHDNGRGIDVQNIRQFGNGLKNMEKRMKDMGIEFRIENKNGTLITIHRNVKSF
ncbi:MAG: sensor histidine kinase [Chitinophagaceae bacterium]|nr:sensor histidine kinase [Chitinophagaceae bacterium]